MEELIIRTRSSKSHILVGESFENLKKHLPEKKIIIISDNNLVKLYGKSFPKGQLVLVPVGEQHKTLETVAKIFEEFIRIGVDRNWFVLGIGGGVVCDITGFVASTYMRGMDFGFVSTSLLSQVDASVGGKNGVNFKEFKNMVGTITQPKFVLCDTKMLETLPETELKCGFAEIIKHGIISGNKYFELISKNRDKAFALEKEIMDELVLGSVSLKVGIVEADEKESGERKVLNFGHSFGHAIEISSGMSHGEAVAIGMFISAKISAALGITTPENVSVLKNILTDYKLPTETKVTPEILFNALRKDKKKHSDNLHFVFMKDIGNVFSEPISFIEIEKLYLKHCL